jgi:hypothetical protein
MNPVTTAYPRIVQDGRTAGEGPRWARPGGSAEVFLGRAANATGWLAKTGWRAARNLPGGDTAERQLRRLEKSMVTELRRRLEPAGTTPGFAWRPIGSPATDAAVTRADGELMTFVRPLNGHTEPLRAGMAELLNRSASSDAVQGREYLYTTILRQLVPDEARIVATLADGSPRAAVDVVVRTTFGGVRRPVLANVSTVGKHAGVSAPDYAPNYVTRLHLLGLIDMGDEDSELAEDYDRLLSDAAVRDAQQRVRKATVLRHTILLSALGTQFWAECDPTVRSIGH